MIIFVFRKEGGSLCTLMQVGTASDGHPEVLGPPLADLAEDIVLQPQLAGHLVPQQVGPWHSSDHWACQGCMPQSITRFRGTYL